MVSILPSGLRFKPNWPDFNVHPLLELKRLWLMMISWSPAAHLMIYPRLIVKRCVSSMPPDRLLGRWRNMR